MTNTPQSPRCLPEEQLKELFAMLESNSRQERLIAIRIVGETGGLAALQKLRKRLGFVNQELQE